MGIPVQGGWFRCPSQRVAQGAVVALHDLREPLRATVEPFAHVCDVPERPPTKPTPKSPNSRPAAGRPRAAAEPHCANSLRRTRCRRSPGSARSVARATRVATTANPLADAIARGAPSRPRFGAEPHEAREAGGRARRRTRRGARREHCGARGSHTPRAAAMRGASDVCVQRRDPISGGDGRQPDTHAPVEPVECASHDMRQRTTWGADSVCPPSIHVGSRGASGCRLHHGAILRVPANRGGLHPCVHAA